MREISKGKILTGRKAVDAYREAHTALYAVNPQRKSIPEEHTPLLNKLKADFKKQGFESLDQFFAANDQLNLEEAGLAGKADLTEADRKVLEEKWK